MPTRLRRGIDRCTDVVCGVPHQANRGSVRSKLVLSLAAMFLAVIMVNELVERIVIGPEFAALERTSAARDALRVQTAIENEMDHFGELAANWASNLSGDHSSTWHEHELQWICTVEDHGDTTWILGSNHERDDDVVELIEAARRASSSASESPRKPFQGLARIDNGALVMCSASPIPNSAEPSSDPTHQTLVVGRELTPQFFDKLCEQTQVDFVLQPPRQSESMVMWEAAKVLVVEFPLVSTPATDHTASSSVDERSATSLANVFIRIPRQIVSRADHTFSMARNLFILGSVLAILSLLLTLQWIVVFPLNRVRDHFNAVGVDGMTVSPLLLECDDEIGDLSRAFDQMIHRLGETQKQLSEASQASGRSEVAATVIHNVGNVLTNVNSLIDTASDRVGSLRVEPLRQLARRLQEPGGSPELIQATPLYLDSLANKWRSDQDSLSETLATLNDNVKHIHDIIRDQQRHADQQIEYGMVDVGSILDDAIGCCSAKLTEESVAVRMDDHGKVFAYGDRSLLLQTIINIISNAAQAMTLSPQDQRTLNVCLLDHGNEVRIEIRDSGCGMSAETLSRVFDAHFTLREGGTGLGLHFCANTIRKLGGSIQAHSDGIGHGSTFAIRLEKSKQRTSSAAHADESIIENEETLA
ncbi:ATP-binding protein [Rubripirellula tenax]|uniref:ATP-binding protein n=1 Tax=Rubripirellula tenax TaxID=2528015 RepID=UPI0016444BA8|nr:ATP-binding protein [Rubripirellula tenax]